MEKRHYTMHPGFGRLCCFHSRRGKRRRNSGPSVSRRDVGRAVDHVYLEQDTERQARREGLIACERPQESWTALLGVVGSKSTVKGLRQRTIRHRRNGAGRRVGARGGGGGRGGGVTRGDVHRHAGQRGGRGIKTRSSKTGRLFLSRVGGRRRGGRLEEILPFLQVGRRRFGCCTPVPEDFFHLHRPPLTRSSQVLSPLIPCIGGHTPDREDQDGPDDEVGEGDVCTAQADCHRPPPSRRPRYVILLLPIHPSVPAPGSTIAGDPGGLRGPHMLLIVRQCHGTDERYLVSSIVKPDERRRPRCTDEGAKVEPDEVDCRCRRRRLYPRRKWRDKFPAESGAGRAAVLRSFGRYERPKSLAH